MIAIVGQTVKRAFKLGKLGRLLSLGGVLILLLTLLGVTGIIAQDAKPDNAVGFYVKDGLQQWIIPGQNITVNRLGRLTPSDFENLYPMTLSQEADIVHSIPPGPVIIDGLRYAANQISMFNGKRLRFTLDQDNNLFAFTTVVGFEQFQQQQAQQYTPLTTDVYSFFFQDWYYTGNYFGLVPGNGIPYLSQVGMDKVISSAKINTSSQWAYLFNNANYGGDYFGMPPGSSYPWLANQGWNDRASSV